MFEVALIIALLLIAAAIRENTNKMVTIANIRFRQIETANGQLRQLTQASGNPLVSIRNGNLSAERES